MPAKGHGAGGWPGREPKGEEAAHHAAHVRQQMGCIGHNGQAVCQIPTCKGKTMYGLAPQRVCTGMEKAGGWGDTHQHGNCGFSPLVMGLQVVFTFFFSLIQIF